MRRESTGDDLASVLVALRRHWAVVLACTLVALAVGALLVQGRDDVHTARAQLLITPIADNDQDLLGLPLLRDVGDDARTMETSAGLLDTTSIAEAAAATLGEGWTASEVRAAVDVRPRGQSNLLDLTARADSADEVVRVASAYAEAVTTVRADELHEAVEAALDSIEDQLAEPGLSDVASVELRDRVRRLAPLLGGDDPTVAVVQEARATGVAPTSTAVDVGLAGVLGLGLGGVVAVVLQRGRPRAVRNEEDITDVLAGPVVANLAQRWTVLDPDHGTWGPGHDALADVPPIVALGTPGHRSALITAPSRSEAASHIAALLATALTASGTGVLLVDAGRRAELTTSLGVAAPREPWWVDGAELDRIVTPIQDMPGVELLPAPHDGSTVPRRTLGAATERALWWSRSRGRSEIVLIDGAELGEHADLAPLLGLVDDVLVVTEIDFTSLASLTRLADRMTARGAVVSGHIVVER